MSPKNVFVAILMAVALAMGIFLGVRTQAPEEPLAAFVLPAPTPLPEFALVDQSGNTVTRDTFRGRWSLVFFGFTHCPDICPTTLQILATAQEELAESARSPLPRIVLVSVDPERDTPELMGRYLDYFGDGHLGITGSLDELKKLTTALGIFFEKQPGTDENYSVDHSAAVLVINPAAEFHALFSGSHKADNFVHDLPLILASY